MLWRRFRAKPAQALAPLFALIAVTGCAVVPPQTVVPDQFAPPGTVVDLRLDWDGGGPAPIARLIDGGSATAEVVGASIMQPYMLLLLPVTLPLAIGVDAGISAANASRERQARLLASSITSVPDRESVLATLGHAFSGELGWVVLVPDAAGDANDPEAVAPTPRTLHFEISPLVAMRKDARAVLFRFDVAAWGGDSDFFRTQALVHSDTLPDPVKDAASRERLVAVIGALYPVDQADADTATANARRDALKDAESDRLSDEEARLLLIDAWTRDDGTRLKEAYRAAAWQLAQVVRAMREHPGPPARNSMSVTRAIFPVFYDDDLPVSDLDVIEIERSGRRVLRARVEPMRSGGSGADPAANLWFSVPAQGSGHEAEKALIDLFYSTQPKPGSAPLTSP
jgi:hypothetical protein